MRGRLRAGPGRHGWRVRPCSEGIPCLPVNCVDWFVPTGQAPTMVLNLLGVPSSMGAFAPGQEDAPAALRAAGLVDQLQAAGVEVNDLGDLPRRRWTPDADNPIAQNVAA